MKTLISRIVLLTVLVFAGAATSLAAKDGLPLLFLKATDIKGDSVVVGHEGESDLNSLSFGVSNSSSVSGGGSGAGKATFKDIVIVKRQDSATTALFLNCVTGKFIKEVSITARFPDGLMEDYLVIKLTNVMVSSLSETSAGADGIFEEASFTYAKIEIAVRKRDAKGNLSTWEKVSWDVASNTAN